MPNPVASGKILRKLDGPQEERSKGRGGRGEEEREKEKSQSKTGEAIVHVSWREILEFHAPVLLNMFQELMPK